MTIKPRRKGLFVPQIPFLNQLSLFFYPKSIVKKRKSRLSKERRITFTSFTLFALGRTGSVLLLRFRGLHVNFDLLRRPAGGGVAIQVFSVDGLIWWIT